MQYLETLNAGDIFLFENNRFILTTDFKKSSKNTLRLCINIKNGSPRWLLDNSITEFCELFYRDQDNNFLTLKTYDKQDI